MNKEDVIIKKLEKHDRALEHHSEQLDMIVAKVVEHHARFDELVTKSLFGESMDQLQKGQDEIIGILRRLDDEQVGTTDRLDRHESEITRLKTHVRLV